MQRLVVVFALALLSLSLFSSRSEAQQALSGQQTASVPNSRGQGQSRVAPAQVNKPAPNPSTIVFKDGRLSVEAKNHSLALLADEISGKTQVPVVLDSEVADLPVSISFQGLALDEGLRQIFKNYDAFYMYGAENEAATTLKAIWVYPKGKAAGLEPVPPEKWASTKELQGFIKSKDPRVRAQAVQALVERGGSQALPTVTQALKDADPIVRASALYGATDAGLQVPEESIRDLVTDDDSAEVRFLALQSLADSPDASALAEAALNDPSEANRVQAREILSRLGVDTPPPSSAPPNVQKGPNQ